MQVLVCSGLSAQLYYIIPRGPISPCLSRFVFHSLNQKQSPIDENTSTYSIIPKLLNLYTSSSQ